MEETRKPKIEKKKRTKKTKHIDYLLTYNGTQCQLPFPLRISVDEYIVKVLLELFKTATAFCLATLG